MSPSSVRLALRDLRNVAQAQLAVRLKSVYCPSIFGHFGVNSACNLRCSYCYVAEPETFPSGYSEVGLPLDDAKRVLDHLREECITLRLQGGEPLLYEHINELARYSKEDIRFRHLSVITNGLLLQKNPERFAELLVHLDAITLSLDGTRIAEYPERMGALMEFLPDLAELCRAHGIHLTSNYTATWDELAEPWRIEETIADYQEHIPFFYIMPVRRVGKVPLRLLKNAQKLGRKYSLGYYGGPEYPARENVAWYRRHCSPKLKIKVDAKGGLIFPCENYSKSLGSLVDHTIRELWHDDLPDVPNEGCLGCGKQRFRLQAFKRIDRQLSFAWKAGTGRLDWSRARRPIAPRPPGSTRRHRTALPVLRSERRPERPPART